MGSLWSIISGDNPAFTLEAKYSLKVGDANYDAYVDALARLFDQFAENDVLTLSNYTKAYIGGL